MFLVGSQLSSNHTRSDWRIWPYWYLMWGIICTVSESDNQTNPVRYKQGFPEFLAARYDFFRNSMPVSRNRPSKFDGRVFGQAADRSPWNRGPLDRTNDLSIVLYRFLVFNDCQTPWIAKFITGRFCICLIVIFF